METWSAHQLYDLARETLDDAQAADIKSYFQRLSANGYPVIFSIGHLSHITSIDYRILRETVRRNRESINYKIFSIKKRSGGRRFIHSVNNPIFRAHQFINKEILQLTKPHPSSIAFHRDGGIKKCASMHCGARTLFQYDLENFFHSINEVQVFSVFKGMGYKDLLSFELAKICTTTFMPKSLQSLLPKQYYSYNSALPYQKDSLLGVLPQGAPTSPMLSNLVARNLDTRLFYLAKNEGLVYTRYADDLSFSTSKIISQSSISNLNTLIQSEVKRSGFIINKKKTRIARQGSKKIVLGLLVDGSEPRLSRETYNRIDRLLHASAKYGIPATAAHEKFDSAYGFYNHLRGLIWFVKDVDRPRWKEFDDRFLKLHVPN